MARQPGQAPAHVKPRWPGVAAPHSQEPATDGWCRKACCKPRSKCCYKCIVRRPAVARLVQAACDIWVGEAGREPTWFVPGGPAAAFQGCSQALFRDPVAVHSEFAGVCGKRCEWVPSFFTNESPPKEAVSAAMAPALLFRPLQPVQRAVRRARGKRR